MKEMGLERGDCVVVHSSFKSLELKDNIPQDVIHTFLEYLGPEGTVVMPTFTYSYVGIWNVEPFNAATTPGKGTGILSETLRNHPEARRSEHPTYSVAAVGRYAGKITEGRQRASALGSGSSYDEMYKLGAKVLLMGVGSDRNSMLHYTEVKAGLPYNDIPFREFWGRTALVEENGRAVEVQLVKEFPGCSLNFGAADDFLGAKNILQRGKICAADSMLISVNEMVTAVIEKLREQPDWLLCDKFVCEPCNLRMKRLREKGLI